MPHFIIHVLGTLYLTILTLIIPVVLPQTFYLCNALIIYKVAKAINGHIANARSFNRIMLGATLIM